MCSDEPLPGPLLDGPVLGGTRWVRWQRNSAIEATDAGAGNMATHRNHLSNGMASIRPGSKFGPADSQRFSGPVTGKAVWFSHGLRPPKDGRLRAVNVEGVEGGSEFHQMQIAGIQIIQPNVNILSGVRGFNTFVDIINHVPKTVTPPIPAVEQLEFGPIWIGLELVER